MTSIGPQRATPSSPARIAAEVADTKWQIGDSARPTSDHFRALGAEDNFASLRLGRYLVWHHDADYPALVLVGSELIELKTVGHLRAVCEMLNIEWKTP